MNREVNIDSPPRTMMEVYKSLPEGTLVELIDNVLYMSPSLFINTRRFYVSYSEFFAI